MPLIFVGVFQSYVDATPSSSQWETLADAMDDELKFLVDEEFDWRKTRFKFAGAGPLNTPRVPEHFTGEPVFLRLKVGVCVYGCVVAVVVVGASAR